MGWGIWGAGYGVGMWGGEHINFRNGAGILYICYVVHYDTVGHVHTNFPVGPNSCMNAAVYYGTAGHVHINFPVGPTLNTMLCTSLRHGRPRPY